MEKTPTKYQMSIQQPAISIQFPHQNTRMCVKKISKNDQHRRVSSGFFTSKGIQRGSPALFSSRALSRRTHDVTQRTLATVRVTGLIFQLHP